MIQEYGIVLMEREVGENNKFIDVFTEKNGVIEILVKGGAKITSKLSSGTQLFSYSKFCMREYKDYYILSEAEPQHIFYGLRNSLLKISLASYFADILRYCIDPHTQNSDIMRLFLNSLYFLEKGQRSDVMLKAVFELRLMSDIGYMPDIVACRGCAAFEPKELHISLVDGSFLCESCFAEIRDTASEDDYLPIDLSVLHSIRHIALVEQERLFNFRTSEETLSKLVYFTENYLTRNLERYFKTLDIYKAFSKDFEL